MTDILGHDVNGRPLRAGDRCVITGLKNDASANGAITMIVRPSDGGWLIVDCPPTKPGFTCVSIRPENLRRLDDRTDHQPSEYTYDELLDSLKTGAPNHAKA